MQHRSTRATSNSLVASTIPAILAMLGLVIATGPLAAQEDESTDEVAELDETLVEDSEEEADDEEEASESEEESDEAMEEMTVTGSRLPEGDPTALVHSYTAEDIAASGASTIDDFMRKLQWQFSSTNPQTSYIGDTGDDLSGDSGGLYGRFDLATANLQGLGSGNTLVLLNGRRVAGYGGSERDIVNLLGIPMHAVERVEIQLDGGSSVYGADAIAGVINFITKQNYRGLTANFKQEHSTTGSDLVSGGVTIGATWGFMAGGNATLTISKDEQEPIINSKTGWTTRDYRDLMGPEFDYRNYRVSQPGVVNYWNGSKRYPGPYYWDYYIDGSFNQDPAKLVSFQLPPEHSGLNATIDDFKSGPRGNWISHPEHIDPYDYIAHENGAHSRKDGVVLAMQHKLFEQFQVFVDGFWSKSDAYQKRPLPFISAVVPASNAYNPFGEPMFVYYAPGREQVNGLLPTPFSEGIDERMSLTVGFKWKFGNQELSVEATESESTTDNVRFSVPLSRERYAPGTEEYYSRLSSPDPAVAFNFFGNGTHQGSAFSDFLGETSRSIGLNNTRTARAVLAGYLWQFRGDEIRYVVGTSRTVRGYETRYVANFGYTRYEFDYNLVWNGFKRPEYRNESYFFEVFIPLLSEQHAGWWGQSLELTLKNTHTIDHSWGAVGGGINFLGEEIEIEAWDPVTTDWGTETGYSYAYGASEDAEFVKYEEGNNAPNIGFIYYPTETLRMTFNFSRSIQQPLISELYDTYDEFEWQTYDILDIYDPDGPTLHPVVPYRYSYANPDLDASISDNWSIRAVWNPAFISGLEVQASFVNTSFRGMILHSRQYQSEPTALRYPELAVRNERGDLISLNYDYFNGELRQSSSADLLIKYRFSTGGFGSVETQFEYHRLLDNYNEPLPNLIFDNSGTVLAPDRYKSKLKLFWDWRKISANATIDYTPGYLNNRAHYCSYQQKFNQVGRCAEIALTDWLNSYLELPVASYTQVDGTIAYQFNRELQFRIGGQNIFNRSSPLTVRGGLPYDATRWNGRGQVLFLSLQYAM